MLYDRLNKNLALAETLAIKFISPRAEFCHCTTLVKEKHHESGQELLSRWIYFTYYLRKPRNQGICCYLED